MAKKIITSRSLNIYSKIVCLSLGLMSLSACSVHKASFDCPNGKGMGCGSMTEVHQAIKDRSFADKVESGKSKKSASVCVSCQKANPIAQSTTTQVIGNVIIPNANLNTINKSKSLVTRSQDKIIRIWFNSYFDDYNNFHDSQYIYTIIRPAQWIVASGEGL